MADARVDTEGDPPSEGGGLGRDFRLYATGQTVSIVGDRIALIALVFLVVRLSHGYPPAIGFFYVCNVLPSVLAGLAVGVLADRYDRQTLMVGCDLGRALLMVAIPLLAVFTLWTLYPLVVVLASLTLVFDTSSRAALPDIVPEGQMMAANAVLRSIRSSADFAYAVGGALVALLGTQVPFYFDAATFVVSGATIISMRFPPRLSGLKTVRAGFLAQIGEGIRFQMRQSFLKWSTFAFLVAPFAGGVVFVLVPLYANHVLAHGPGLFGPFRNGAFRFSVLEVAVGVGALAGSRVAPRLAQRIPAGTVFALGISGLGVATASLALVHNVYPALLSMALQGFFNSLFLVPGMTLVQTLVPTELRGRVVSARLTFITGALALGSAVGGLVLVVVPLADVWFLSGAIIAAASLFLWLRPEVRGQV